MFSIDPMSRCPVYEQLVEQVETYVLKGILKAGDQMPSVRNTVQKAYSELDFRGIIQSVPGKGCFVSKDAFYAIEKKKRAHLNGLKDQIEEMRLAGIEKQEILYLIEQIYEAGGAEK